MVDQKLLLELGFAFLYLLSYWYLDYCSSPLVPLG